MRSNLGFKMRMKALFAAAALAVGLATVPAKADVTWYVTGTFNDGGTLTGQFTLNVYGFLLNDFSFTTTAGSALPGFTYNSSTSYYSNGTFFTDAQPGYFGDLHLTFANDLNVGSLNNPLVGGAPGPSWECASSWSCYVPEGGTTRYIASGYASTDVISGAVPEPATWALMIFAFAALGYAASRRAVSSGFAA